MDKVGRPSLAVIQASLDPHCSAITGRDARATSARGTAIPTAGQPRPTRASAEQLPLSPFSRPSDLTQFVLEAPQLALQFLHVRFQACQSVEGFVSSGGGGWRRGGDFKIRFGKVAGRR